MLAAILAGSGALAHSTRGSAAQESVRREVVAAGGLLFVSAQHGLAEVGGARGLPTASAETRRALERLESTLAGAGSSMEQVVATTVYVKHASDLDAVDAVYGLAFDADPPARTTVVADLASGALVAMSAVAVPDGVARETMHPAGWPRPVSPVSFAVRAGDLGVKFTTVFTWNKSVVSFLVHNYGLRKYLTKKFKYDHSRVQKHDDTTKVLPSVF
jgi:2-iminobutanoate/2-iminopropanoate deaminase